MLRVLLLSGFALSCRSPATPRPPRTLEISTPGSPVVILSDEQLLHHRSSVSLVVSNTPAYDRSTLKLTAVPMKALLPAEYSRPEFNIVFECLDGFAAVIPASRVLDGSREHPQALLAIEGPMAPWPPLRQRPGATAGPFYLIWTRLPSSRMVPEEWPFQIRKITVKPLAEMQLRNISPDSSAGSNSAITGGFEVFVRQCFPCHTLNGAGDGHMGPDLNLPMNPTEYFKEGIFEKYVRNPDSVRKWNGQRMPSFPKEVLTDEELVQIRLYLEYMARRKSHSSSSGD